MKLVYPLEEIQLNNVGDFESTWQRGDGSTSESENFEGLGL